MNERITLRNWLANLGKGLWQAICWVGRCLNPKYKTPFWRVIWSVLTICVIVCTCVLTRVWYQEEREHLNRWGEKQRISNQLVFIKPSYSDKPGIIKNITTGEVVTKGIDWIALPADEDSLIVYSKDNKRGYLNRFNGEIVIPARYPKAWVFSEGIAAVSEGDSIFSSTTWGKLSTIRSFV